MNELHLTAELVFLKVATQFFRFPVEREIRMSFWLPNALVSTPAAITNVSGAIEIGKLAVVNILVMENYFFDKIIEVGTDFRLGLFPTEFACGKVLKIERHIR